MLCQTPLNYCLLESPGVCGDGREAARNNTDAHLSSILLPKIQTASHNYGFAVGFLESRLTNGKHGICISEPSLPLPPVLSKIYCCLVLVPQLCFISSLTILCDCFPSCLYIPSFREIKLIGISLSFLFLHVCRFGGHCQKHIYNRSFSLLENNLAGNSCK